ncbi:MAG TPA: M48 family metallopeptidase [Blastocatellia bacterium]|nr:M48 family metallopeptidase [Blastocatellia bacterium]
MKINLLKRVTVLLLTALIGLPSALFADDKKDPKDTKKADDKPTVQQPAAAANKGKLDEDEDPRLIGKRNINKRQINFYSLDKEVALGRRMAAQVDQQGKFIDDPIITEYVNRVGQNIALHSDAKIPFTIKVLDSDDVNAFALPGGFLYVNKGAILAADSESELAGVMAHEIAHVAARHGVEQASKGTLANIAFIPLIFVTGGLGYLAYEAYQIGVPLAFLKFTRGAEAEADKLGAEYLWASGYDPNNFLTFFEKLEKKEKGKPGTLSKLFGTHPPTPDRITKVHDLLVRFPDRDEYMITSSDFLRAKSRLLAVTNARVLDGSGNRDTGPKRPTLKRRKDGTDDQTSPDSPTTTETPKDRPVLKRRDSDGKPPDAEKKP